MGLSQSTLGGGFGPEPEYSGRGFWASARLLWEGVLGLSQSTLGGGFGPQPEYSGRGFVILLHNLLEKFFLIMTPYGILEF